MEVERRGFPERISDNEDTFLTHLMGVVESVDELCCVDISRTPHSYHLRIAPSVPMYINSIIGEVTKFHNQFGIKIDMGKSIKATSVITFDIQFRNN